MFHINFYPTKSKITNNQSEVKIEVDYKEKSSLYKKDITPNTISH